MRDIPRICGFGYGASVLASLLLFCIVSGCWSSPVGQEEVVVYAALDAEFSEPILQAFEEETGIKVRLKTDVESTKTVGLVNLIIHEQNRPRCDLFWNNEVLHTLRLEKQGLLRPYVSPQAAAFPENYRSADGTWHGLAARARVLLVNTDIVAEHEMPNSIHDLADPRWKGKVGIAKPAFGTTATHAAVLFATWGDEQAKQFLTAVKANAQVLGGNKQVAQSVAAGQLAFGITDTDDAMIEVEHGFPVRIIFPDQGEGQLGTLMIPNSLGMIRGGKNPGAAEKLVDYLLRPKVEAALAEGPSAQFPVNPAVQIRSRAMPTEALRWMDVDFDAAVDKWDVAIEFVQKTFAVAE